MAEAINSIHVLDPPRAQPPIALVVEHNLELAHFIGVSLAGDHRVELATNGEEGLQKVHGLHPDIIIAEHVLPHFEGASLVRRVRAQACCSTIPVLLLIADYPSRADLLEEALQDYLVRPFSGKELRLRVHNLLALKQADDIRRQAGNNPLTANNFGEGVFRELVESAPDAMVIVNSRGAISMVNAQAERLFGYRREELVGQTIEVLVPEHYRSEHVGQRAHYMRYPKLRPMASGLELFALRKDGTEFPAEICLSPIATGNGMLIAGAIRDITDRKEAEKIARQLAVEEVARLHAEEAVRVRDDFVAMAGHELKTPLAAMVMQVQSIQREMSSTPPTNLLEHLDKVVRSGLRMTKLVNQLLDVSRINEGRLNLVAEGFDLVEVVRGVVERFAQESERAKSPISVRGADELLGCWDRLRIAQVVANLLENALKYGQGRPVEIDIASTEDTAVVHVIDHGIGIEADQQLKIFDRFERVGATHDFGGLGLGLWISKQIVEASGGSLTVDSELNRGAVFTCSLPLSSLH